MTNAISSAVPAVTTKKNAARFTLSVKFVGMAPDEELLGLVRSYFSDRTGPSSVSIERLPCNRRFRARVGMRGGAFEHEDPRLALDGALSQLT